MVGHFCCWRWGRRGGLAHVECPVVQVSVRWRGEGGGAEWSLVVSLLIIAFL